jgi:hypothetical protein
VRLGILDHVLADDALKGKDHVVCRHLYTIVEQDPLAELDLQGLFVQPLHGLGQFQMDAAAGIAGDQAVKHVADHGLRLSAAVVGRIQGDERASHGHNDDITCGWRGGSGDHHLLHLHCLFDLYLHRLFDNSLHHLRGGDGAASHASQHRQRRRAH